MKQQILFTSLLYTLFFFTLNSYGQNSHSASRIIIEGDLPPQFNKEMAVLQTYPRDILTTRDVSVKYIDGTISDKTVKWTIETDQRTMIRGPYLAPDPFQGITMQPGDSVFIHRMDNNTFKFNGKGANVWDMVFHLKEAADSLDNLPEFIPLKKKYDAINSVNEYLQWSALLTKRLNILLPILETYKNKVPQKAYMENLFLLVERTEKRRMSKFTHIRINPNVSDINHLGLSNYDVGRIYDSTIVNKWSNWLCYENSSQVDLFYQLTRIKLDEYRRNNKFFRTNNTDKFMFPQKEDFYLHAYNISKNKLKGVLREKMLAFIFWDKDGILDEVGLSPKVDSLLQDYYNTPGFKPYKQAVKNAELKYRKKYGTTHLPSFSLTDTKGNIITEKNLIGKVIILDFWFTGCVGCIQMTPAMKKVEDHFANDSNVVFVKVSTDKDRQKWLSSIQTQQFISGSGLQLYTGGEGTSHDLIRKLYIGSYPTFYLINSLGKIIPYNSYETDPRLDNGKRLIHLITEELSNSKDGPYILHFQTDSITSYSISGKTVIKSTMAANNPGTFISTTDRNFPFEIKLKKELRNEPSTFSKPDKMMVLSDVEGNFDALRELLQLHGVIDEKLNWNFGNGHLVFGGDIFDRGKQVTECLWFIYTLEEKAKAAGGYVHFILGNHEIMNLQGDLRYMDEKYQKNIPLIGIAQKELYGKDSELGRWLRTKNVMEKVGNILFAHGGVSISMNKAALSLTAINEAARPYYDVIVEQPGDAGLIFHPTKGPLWYRGYYDRININEQLDSTLKIYGADHIVIGHTIYADTISMMCNGKLFNTDTRHESNNSEALYISGKQFFRANREGRKYLIYTEE